MELNGGVGGGFETHPYEVVVGGERCPSTGSGRTGFLSAEKGDH